MTPTLERKMKKWIVVLIALKYLEENQQKTCQHHLMADTVLIGQFMVK